MKKMQKVISVLLAACLLAGIATIAAFAETSIKTTVNGDAEKGDLTGWKTYANINSGMSLANIADPADSGNRVIKFTPATSGDLTDWSIPMFDIGADVFRDIENGYSGGGAGTYKISLRVKTNTADTQFAHLSLRTGSWNWSDSTYNRIGYNKDAWIRLNEDVTNDANATIQYDSISKWNTVTKTFTVTDAFINAKKAEFAKGTASAYELYVSIDNPAVVYYIDDVTVVSAPAKPENKSVVNGDAEKGTLEGWSGLFGNGTLTNETIDGSKVIHFVPKANDVYSSVMFDLGPAIVKDANNGYNGSGAGKYTVSFRVKGDSPQAEDGVFYVSMISNVWNKINVKPDESKKYINVSQSEWTKYTFTFDITADTLKALDSKDAYVISLRFDGSGTDYSYGKGNYIGYYIDDMKIFNGTAPAEEEITEKKIINGDAETGTLEGWSGLFGNGTLTNETMDGSKVIHFVPKANDVYSSVMFDLGPAIVKDEAKGYNGSGAGKYAVSFRIKGDGSDDGVFFISLISNAWGKLTVKPDGKVYINVKNGEWTDYTVIFNITDEDLAKLDTIESYLLSLRFDGSGSNSAYGMGNWMSYYIDDMKIAFGDEPQQGGEAVAARKVVNGDAETGTLEGWSGLFDNGTLTNEKIDGSKVIHFVPKANDNYGSVVFDLGAAIINDPACGYNGGGATKYTVSFRIKSDDKNKSGSFTFSLVSYSGAAWDKFKAYSQEKTAVKVTPDWTEYTYTFDITNEMLDAIKGNTEAYKIGIRLDGSGKVLDHQYVDGGNWLGYYIDDVKISYDGMPKDTGDALCVPALVMLIASCVAVAASVIFKKKEQL